MEKLKLVTPTAAYAEQIASYRQECLEAGSTMDGCGSLRFIEDPMEWLADIQRFTRPETLPEGKSLSTQFLTIREEDGRLVGMIDVRHTLTGYLRKFGGNIGYSIRPSERRKGYATEQLRLALPCCKELGLDKVLVTCHVDNVGSRKTILKNGGVYERTNYDPERDRELELYWIDLTDGDK